MNNYLVVFRHHGDGRLCAYESVNGVECTAVWCGTLSELTTHIKNMWTPMTVRVQNNGLRQRVREMLPDTWRVVNIADEEVQP